MNEEERTSQQGGDMEALFSTRVLDLPYSALAYPNPTLLVEKRISALSHFSALGSLGPFVQRIIDLTKRAHALCDQLREHAMGLSRALAESDPIILFDEASESLKATSTATSPASSSADQKIAEIREEVLTLIFQELKKGSEKGLIDAIDTHFANRRPGVRNVAKTQAALLIGKYNQLSFCKKSLEALITYTMVWRGVFYFCVIEDKGSQLQKGLSREKFLSLLPSLTSQLLGILPGVGAIFSSMDLVNTLIELRHSLTDQEKSLAGQIQATEDYLVSYAQILAAWTQLAINQSSEVDNLTETFLKLRRGTADVVATDDVIAPENSL